MYSIAEKRYKSITKRAFESFLELYLIKVYLTDETLNSAGTEGFKKFSYDDQDIPRCLRAYQLPSDKSLFEEATVKLLDTALDNWFEINPIKEYKEIFETKKIIDWQGFKAFYKEDEYTERKCEFCGTKESDFIKLLEGEFIKTKRLATRGKNLEVDRFSPEKGYVNGNIVLACYWCNNAKTDEFEGDEFRPIGELIGKALRARLKKE